LAVSEVHVERPAGEPGAGADGVQAGRVEPAGRELREARVEQGRAGLPLGEGSAPGARRHASPHLHAPISQANQPGGRSRVVGERDGGEAAKKYVDIRTRM